MADLYQDDLAADPSLSDERAESSYDRPVPCEFICGKAGVGKTYGVMRAVAADKTYGILTATTGIAAVNLGAITVHSTIGYSDTASLQDIYLSGRLTRKLHELALSYRRLIVDEGSMIDAMQLDLWYRGVEDANRYRDVREPLGITVIGDFCLALGTLVMMADGTIVPVESVRVGDKVMGPDSSGRTVIRTTTGTDALYRVDQTNGDSYTVKRGHLLALVRGVDGSREESWGIRYPAMSKAFTMPVESLAEKSSKFRECFVGYKAGVIRFPELDVSIDPYFLGLWLGDGDHDGTRITTADEEVVDYCRAYAGELEMGLRVHGWERSPDTIRIRITNGRRGGKTGNPLWAMFKSYGLARNKHIPRDYLHNSERVRLEVLAGLLDTDGSWQGNRFTIVQTRKLLALQIKQLADQLGFRAALYLGIHASWVVSIGGDTWRIPTRIARKQSIPRNLGRSRLTSTLQITYVGCGAYAGFEIDGDHLFLLADGTVTHNCQLPPVKARWAFDADCWHYFADNTTRLDKVWRQDTGPFLDALNLARAGLGREAAETLAVAGATFHTSAATEFDGTTILPKNEMVSKYNAMALDRVRGRAFSVTSQRWGQQRKEWGLNLRTHEWGIPPTVPLKVGAYVMILANARDFSVVNGDCGHIVDQDDSGIGVHLIRGDKVVRIEKIVRGVELRDRPEDWPADAPRIPKGDDDGTTYLPRPHFRGGVRRYVLGQIEYYPMRLASASTVHKSQGLTLDRVQVDYRDWFFGKPAMLYVALSRCRTLEGLRLVGMREKFAKQCAVDPRVRSWL